MQISYEKIVKSTDRSLPTKLAWQAYLRGQFPRDCMAHVMRTFNLTDGEARGAVFGTISQRTIDKILSHRNGGVSVALAVEATAWGTSIRGLVTTWINHETGRIEDERRRSETDDRRMVEITSRLNADGAR